MNETQEPRALQIISSTIHIVNKVVIVKVEDVFPSSLAKNEQEMPQHL